jgi:hypothetical protein
MTKRGQGSRGAEDGRDMMESLSVHIVLSIEDEERYIAHCLEFDLVAQGENELEAFKNLLDAIEAQTAYALETGDLGHLFSPAPAEYWKVLATAERYVPGTDGWKLPAFISDVECALVHGETRG